MNRRQTFSRRTMSRTCLVRRANWSNIVTRVVSSGSTSGFTEASSAMRSRTRSAKAARLGVPNLRPPSRRTARTTFSIERISFRTERRATRSERHSRQGTALDVDLPVPARAHDLGQRPGVVAVGLVWHRLHGRVGVAFARTLTHDDHVVVEATGNASAVAEVI